MGERTERIMALAAIYRSAGSVREWEAVDKLRAVVQELEDEIERLRDLLIISKEILVRCPKVCNDIYLGSDRHSYMENAKKLAARIDDAIAGEGK